MCLCNDGERKERIALSTFFLFSFSPRYFLFWSMCYFHWDTQLEPLQLRGIVDKKYETGISKGYEKGTNICGTTTIRRLYLSLSHNGFLFLLGQVGR